MPPRISKAKNEPTSQTVNIAQQFIDRMNAQKAVGTFEVPSSGLVLTFRYPSGLGEIESFEKGMIEWTLKTLEMVGGGKFPNPQWAEALTNPAVKIDESALVAAYILYFWSADPSKFSQLDAVRALVAPWEVKRIVEEIDKHHTGGFEARVNDLLEAAKKKSLTMDFSGSSSQSAETSTDAIPRSSRRNKVST